MTILLVEDNPLFSELLERLLEEADIHVVSTLSAAQGWLSTFRADLILVDLGLPDSQGLSTLKGLSFSKTPKIVLTGGEYSIDDAIKLGAVDYLTKTNPKEICERIRFNMKKLVRRPRFSEEVFAQIRSYIEVPTHGELAHVS